MGRISLIASPQADIQGTLHSTESSLTIWHQIKMAKSSSGDHSLSNWKQSNLRKTRNESCPGTNLLRTELHVRTELTCHLEDSNGNQRARSASNPWGLQCHRKQLSLMSSEYHKNQLHRFLLLENVTSKFYLPCILDLKMGNRQHGDDATEEKKARHMKKCAQSTSASLGVRFCGMQVYQANTGSFICKDKYFGRKLSADGFRQALYHFLHNGQRLRTDLFESIIFQLKALKSVIEGQSSYRFYSSSLLIIYEGQEATEHMPASDKQPPGSQTHCPGSSFPNVDVRMIDFAHTTYKGSRNNRTTYDGPDQGYIFGLQNLLQILQDVHEGE
ncbi:inositol hexakisphosphate kinase 3 isoform X2 [Ambystoma mexicanum]